MTAIATAATIVLALVTAAAIGRGVVQLTRDEFLFQRSETSATVAVVASLCGAWSTGVTLLFAQPAIPLPWIVGYHAVGVAIAAGAWAIFEVRIHRTFPPRPLYRVDYDSAGTAVATEVRGAGVDAVMSRVLVPLLTVVAIGGFVASIILS